MKATKNEVYMSFVRTLNVPEWSLPYLLGDTPWEELEDDDRVNLENFRASYDAVSAAGFRLDGRMNLQSAAQTVYGHYKNALQNGTVAGFMIFSNGQLLLTTNEAFTHNFKVIVGRDPIQKLKGNRDTGFHLVPVSLQTACARPSRKTLFA